MFDQLPVPRLIAHRGASAYAPENTLTAFDLALKTGAHVLELDVRMARDGTPVVIHDETVDRTTNGHGLVSDLTLRELRALDAGFHFARPKGPTLFRGREITIPTLEEVVRAFPGVAFNIEIKGDDPAAVSPTLEILAGCAPHTLVLAAHSHRVMQALEEARTNIPLGLSVEQTAALVRRVWRSESLTHWRGRALQIPPRDRRYAWGLLPLPSRRLIHAAQAAGLEVHLWTIDRPHRAARWLRRGVDGIITNDPAALSPLFPARRTNGPERPTAL